MATSPQIESKNLTIIEDQLHMLALAHKKSDVYSNYFTDPALKNLASEISQHAKTQFDGLFNYLNSHQ